MTHKVNDRRPGIAETLPDTTPRHDAGRMDERPHGSAGRAGVSRGQDHLRVVPVVTVTSQVLPPVSR
jgi:hypothetical protein